MSCFSNLIPHTVAIFSIPSMVTVAEIERTLMVCVTLATIPSNATLANEAVVSLSTVDDTGAQLVALIAVLVLMLLFIYSKSQ